MKAKRPRRNSLSSAEKHERSRVSGAQPDRAVSEETRAKLTALQDQLGDLQESLLLTRVENEVEEIRTTLALLPPRIEQLRTRGYVFRSFLENKVRVLEEQWDETHEDISRRVRRHTSALKHEADEAESALHSAMGGGTARVSQAETAITALEQKIDAAQASTQAAYATLQQNVSQAEAQIEQIEWLLDEVDKATFQLYPAEDPVTAYKAQLMETKKDGPKGVLYLTDERLIFEQKEKVATKKVLFIATEKEKIQELIFEVLIGQVEEVKASQKGFLGRKEILELLFVPEADLSTALFRVHGVDSEDLARLIGRVKSGEIAKERTHPKDDAAMETVRAAPTRCPTCGATLDVEIVRGMREITCEYCGSVVRL
jgi:uncharacterized protein YecE (DUF72 family)